MLLCSQPIVSKEAVRDARTAGDNQELIELHLGENSMMIFDDIYWSKGMKEAWQQIKDHPQVTLTVDLFWIGLVFIRKEQVKEHFKIRF